MNQSSSSTELVRVRAYMQLPDAELDRALLESCEIPALVQANNAAGMLPLYLAGNAPIELLVPGDRAAEAEALLAGKAEKE